MQGASYESREPARELGVLQRDFSRGHASRARAELAEVPHLFSCDSFTVFGLGDHSITVTDAFWAFAPTGVPFVDEVGRFFTSGASERVVEPRGSRRRDDACPARTA